MRHQHGQGQGLPNNALPAVASLLVPGLGQLIQGRLGVAMLHLFLACIAWCMVLGWVMMIYSAIEAARYEPMPTGYPPSGHPVGSDDPSTGGPYAGPHHPPAYASGGSGSGVLKFGVGCLAASIGIFTMLIAVSVAIAFWSKIEWPKQFGLETVERAASDSDPAQRLNQQIERFQKQHDELQHRLAIEIPAFRKKLAQDAAVVRDQIGSASPENRVLLEDEVKEIARMMLALDREESHLGQALIRLSQETRRLERLKGSQQVLGADGEKLMAELDQAWQETGAALSQPLEARLGSGAIEDLALEQKTQELIQPAR